MLFEAVVFDMDGLLLDTETIAMQTFEEACAAFDVVMDPSIYFQCLGTNETKSKEILSNGFGNDVPFDEVLQLWSDKYDGLAIEKAVPLKPGVEWFLNQLQSKQVPMAIATSTNYQKAIVKLRNAGLIDFFNAIVAGDQVKQSKPHPEIYLNAAAELALAPNQCLALEDSDNGVRAALAAGMKVVQIPDLIEPSSEVRKLGHTIVASLFDLSIYLEHQVDQEQSGLV